MCHCGSELARECVGSAGLFFHWDDAFASKLAPTGFVADLEEVKRGFCGLFMHTPCYVRKATKPCAVAYGYARIRRLVRLGAGLYRWLATAYQWSGLVARLFHDVQISVNQVI